MADTNTSAPQAAIGAALTAAPEPVTVPKRRLPRFGRTGWALLSLALAVAVWAAVTGIFHPPGYILPTPWDVATRLWTSRAQLVSQAGPTVFEILVGYAIGVAIAVPLGMLIVANRWLDRLLSPLIVSFNSVPKVALAPLFVVWFGYGLAPRIIITFSIAFFPVLIDTVTGLKSVDPEMVQLARSMNASKLRTFVRVRLPHALPSMFAGMKVATSLAVIGGIIGEFVASSEGWGYLLIQAQGHLDTTLIFAILILLAVFATLLYYAVEIIERFAIPWHASQRK